MKSKLLISSPLIVIIGLISIVLTHSALNPTQPLVQTTPDEPQTTSIYPIATTIVKRNTSKTIYSNNTPPAIPAQFAAEVSVFSNGVRLDVGVNDTTPRLGGAVLMAIRMTNVNSSTPVTYGGDFSYFVYSSGGEPVAGAMVKVPTLTITSPYLELPINQTVVLHVWVWKVETSPYFDVEVKSGEDYYIDVWIRGRSIEIGPIRVVAES